MTIYDIDREIQALLDSGIDEETGELLIDTDALEALQMEKDQKIENLALAIKNLTADALAIKAEEQALAQRRKQTEAKAERARQYLEFVLQGEKFQTPRVAVTYRKSTKLQLDDGFILWAQIHEPDFLRYKDPEPDKTAITRAIKSGAEIQGAALVESQTMTIK